uniref:T-cell surface glycoprotein CD3 epsilon chain-like n=1 Tax=Semicossyphus pulcher TaxID=241346 RepID=UPI0037E8C440
MGSMSVGSALAVLLLFIATVNAGRRGGVTFWRKTFTMTCPEKGQWFPKDDPNDNHTAETHTLEYENSRKGPHSCVYVLDKTVYYFYVQGKVCENCFELDAYAMGLAIIMDVVGTMVLMMIIYRCGKKKSSAGLTKASKAPSHSGGRGPPVPSPDYEHLNPHTRTQDPYSMLNRTG